MVDLLLPLIVIAFFATAAVLVRFCDWIIGPDEAQMAGAAGPPTTAQPVPDLQTTGA